MEPPMGESEDAALYQIDCCRSVADVRTWVAAARKGNLHGGKAVLKTHPKWRAAELESAKALVKDQVSDYYREERRKIFWF